MKPDEAALCDLLEVTRRVMLPAKDNGTFWCEGVNPLRMCEWALSVRAQTRAPGSPRRPRANRRRAAPVAVRSPASRPQRLDQRTPRINVPARRCPPQELAEVEDEIKAAQSSVRKRRSGGDDDDTAGDLSFAEATRRVQDEVGDLIFDVIMLACVCERDFGGVGGRFSSGFTLAGAAANASAKVKRRCPYTFGPRARLGPCPDKATEEAAWADVKAMEKASRAPGGGPMPPAPPTYNSAWDRWCFKSGRLFDGQAVLPVAVAAAFATGCVFGARSWR